MWETAVHFDINSLGFELQSEMKHSFKSFQQQIQANLQVEMFTLDSKFSALQFTQTNSIHITWGNIFIRNQIIQSWQ